MLSGIWVVGFPILPTCARDTLIFNNVCSVVHTFLFYRCFRMNQHFLKLLVGTQNGLWTRKEPAVKIFARRLILLNWKRVQPPTQTIWMREVMQHVQLEKLKYTIRGSVDQFDSLSWTTLATLGYNSPILCSSSKLIATIYDCIHL